MILMLILILCVSQGGVLMLVGNHLAYLLLVFFAHVGEYIAVGLCNERIITTYKLKVP